MPDEKSPDASAVGVAASTATMIDGAGLGVHFRRNRGSHRNFTELFAGKKRRAKSNEFWALRNVSFTVRSGEAIGVVGRNGQGKSTLLKLVAGVLLPDEGSVRVHGGVAPLIELTGGFSGDLTVRDNIHLASGLHGLSRGEIADRFDSIVSFAEAADVLDTPVQAPLERHEGARRVRRGLTARRARAVGR